jgi:hypothetical protein
LIGYSNKPDKSYLTALTRTKPSAPARLLGENGFLVGRSLDYGCGKGFDADFYGMEGYDPYYRPGYPTGKFDTIVCIYVLNVIPESSLRYEIMYAILGLLKEGGTAYITVRRALKQIGYTSRGTYQDHIVLGFPTLHRAKHFTTYQLGAI